MVQRLSGAAAQPSLNRNCTPPYAASRRIAGARRAVLMRFVETRLPGAFILELERREDDRGFFARSFCQREFAEYGLNPVIAQANVLVSKRKGTLRGLHFQFPPSADTKIVTVTRGAILDIIVDLR